MTILEQIPSWIQAAIAASLFVGALVWRFATQDNRITTTITHLEKLEEDHNETVRLLHDTALIVARLEERTSS